MRRLPIYFLMDLSESMIGEPMSFMEDGMAMIVKSLKSDPYALETVWISIVGFAGQAQTIIPMTEIINFYPPRFPVGSGTSYGNGLGHLMFELKKNIIPTTLEQKGDWKPIVFFFTDGQPTDNYAGPFQEWKNNWQKKVNMVTVALGPDTNLPLMRELSENVFTIEQINENSFKEIFKWVTASIKMSSQSVDSNGSGFELDKLKDNLLQKVENPKSYEPKEPDVVVFSGKCQVNKKPYLIKYKKQLEDSYFGGMNLTTSIYKLAGGFPLNDSYYEWSSEGSFNQTVSTKQLRGYPTCPCCGNQYGIAICACGQIHCVGTEKVSTCPTCNTAGEYGQSGGDGMDINRSRG